MKINRILEFAKNEFIYGGHLSALSAVSIVVMSAVVLNTRSDYYFLWVVYSIFYVINLNDIAQQIKKDILINSERTLYYENPNSTVRSTTIIVLLLNLVLCYPGGSHNLLFGSLIFTLGLCLRDLTEGIGFRGLFTSLILSLLPIFLASYHSQPFTLQVFAISAFVFLKIFDNQLFFDMIHTKIDEENRMLTIPVVFGKKVSRCLLEIINILIIMLVICGVYFNIFRPFVLTIILSSFYSIHYMSKIENADNNFKYFLFADVLFADAEPFVWVGLILFGKFLNC